MQWTKLKEDQESKEQQCKQIYVKRFSRILDNAHNSSPNVYIVHVVAKWSCKMIELYNYGGGTMHILTLQFRAKILGKNWNNYRIPKSKISPQNK